MTDHLPVAAKVPAFRMEGDRRDLRLDACRGLALWFIFLDHIPDNALAWLTIRNYGFSDTSEVFVFVSGYTCMVAYGGALRTQGWPTTVTLVVLCVPAVYFGLAVLAHHDDGRRVGSLERKNQIQQNEGIRVPMVDEGHHI